MTMKDHHIAEEGIDTHTHTSRYVPASSAPGSGSKKNTVQHLKGAEETGTFGTHGSTSRYVPVTSRGGDPVVVGTRKKDKKKNEVEEEDFDV